MRTTRSFANFAIHQVGWAMVYILGGLLLCGSVFYGTAYFMGYVPGTLSHAQRLLSEGANAAGSEHKIKSQDDARDAVREHIRQNEGKDHAVKFDKLGVIHTLEGYGVLALYTVDGEKRFKGFNVRSKDGSIEAEERYLEEELQAESVTYK